MDQEQLNNFVSVMAHEPVIILIGQSGCGKGKRVEAILKVYQEILDQSEYELLPIFSTDTGSLFRQEIPKFSPWVRKQLQETQDAGKFQSYVSATMLWSSQIHYHYPGGPILIDGSPRSEEEAQAIINLLGITFGKKIIVINFVLDDAECDQRMQRRNAWLISQGKEPRSDTNTPEKRAQKLADYYTGVVPAVEYMRQSPLVFKKDVVPSGTIQESDEATICAIAEALLFCQK